MFDDCPLASLGRRGDLGTPMRVKLGHHSCVQGDGRYTPRSRMPLRLFTLLLLLALIAGCNWGKRGPNNADPRGAGATTRPIRISDSPPRQLDASPRQMQILAVQVYVLELPRGRVSANEPLWRRIDEHAVDPGAYDVLWANGVRAGVAPLSELNHIRDTLGIETALRLDILGRGIGRQAKEFPVEADVPEKTLFWFDEAKRSQGRTFLRCETLMSVAFEPSPGRLESVRLSMTPVVRSMQPRIVVTPAGDDYTIESVKETNLLDLQLQVDVPLGHFLIVSPSDEATWETSLGRQFFTSERQGERFERVFLLIPQVTAIRNADQH